MNLLSTPSRLSWLVLLFSLGAAGLHANGNTNPVANAGGPYTLTVGGSIVLNGALSNDPDPGDSVMEFEWNIDGSYFGELTGAHPTLAWADFSSFLTPGMHTISLQVCDSSEAMDVATVMLTVVASPHLAVHSPFGGQMDDARIPSGGLVQASDGKLYGTTEQGGANGVGTVFRVNPDGTGFAVLHSFSGTSDGSSPTTARLVQALDGKLYGTTYTGGAHNAGTIFSITTGGTFTVLRSLTSASDGGNPTAGLVQALDGKLYGTTYAGGAHSVGTIFSITTGGTFTVLRSLTSATDGANPYAGLIQASDGALYGTASRGGANSAGTIFSITTGSAFTNLYDLDGTTDGANPLAELVQGSDSKLYGTTSQGGVNTFGTVFYVDTDGSYFTVIQNQWYEDSLDGTTDGANPTAGLFKSPFDGLLYGTAGQGGANGFGTIFSIYYQDGTQFNLVHTLGAASDGATPFGGLMLDNSGSLFGTTQYGGPSDNGTLFGLQPDGTWFGVLHTLDGSCDGAHPTAALVQDPNTFYYYGTTTQGGANGGGTIFSAYIGEGASVSVMYALNPTPDGASPTGGVVQGNDGLLYGTTQIGGANGDGTIFSLTTDGYNTFTVLRAFNSTSDGATPLAGLVQATNLKLYGVTTLGGTFGSGTIFSIDPDGGNFAVLRPLSSASDGSAPAASLMQARDGKLYGTTYNGGANGVGTIF